MNTTKEVSANQSNVKNSEESNETPCEQQPQQEYSTSSSTADDHKYPLSPAHSDESGKGIEQKSSIITTGIDQSLSDCDSTQYDITTSFDCLEAVQTSVPLTCLWSNGTQMQQQNPRPNIAGHLSQPPVALPIIAIPQYNSQLPFPDKSGKLPNFTYNQSSITSASSPPFNTSAGYPLVYVSPAGLITVLLKYDVAVELTVDRNIRVVNHRHKAVAATNNRGSVNCIYHVAAKVFQEGTKTEVEVFGERRARMQVDGILFSSGMEVYLLDEKHIVPSYFCFNDMSKDCSVNILFQSATDFSNDLLMKCEEITKNSRYSYHKNGSTTIVINNIKIHQNEFGEVQVISGPKFISTSPIYGSLYLQTHFVEISVQVNWNVCVKRGCHKLNATYTNFIVNNGAHEAGFNQYREVFSRMYNPTVTQFENWLPSLTFLCQGLPQSKTNRLPMNNKNSRERNRASGDQNSDSV